MRLLSLLLVLVLVGCNNKNEVVQYQRVTSVDMAIVFTSSSLYRSGNGYIKYTFIDYPNTSYTANIPDPKCIDPNVIKVGNSIIIPVPIVKNSTYPTGYIDPPSSACVISSTAKPLKRIYNDTLNTNITHAKTCRDCDGKTK